MTLKIGYEPIKGDPEDDSCDHSDNDDTQDEEEFSNPEVYTEEEMEAVEGHIQQSVSYTHLDMDEDENRPYDMEEPNFFGLSIAYDPYMREVVQADRLTTCGGDGGCNICGGLGPFLGFLPCSPHCKPEVQEDKELNGDYDFYRPMIRVEFDG